MFYRTITLAFILFCIEAYAGNTTTLQLPTNEEIVDIDSYGHFSILVGDNGTIVQLDTLNHTAQLMTSGTTEQLLNIEVIDENFAIASGTEVVLLWDGSTWNTVVDLSSNGTPNNIIPVWAPPEKNKIFYQDFNPSGFSFMCSYEVSSGSTSPFCKAYNDAAVKFCGHAGDFKILHMDGGISRISEDMFINNDSQSDEPVYVIPQSQAPFNIAASHIFEESCLPGNIAPTNIHAASNPASPNDPPLFIQFDGSQWNILGAGMPGEVITGMDAVNENYIIAVGFVPNSSNPNINDGVQYIWDGSNWTRQTLPQGTPGIPDIALSASLPDVIFRDTFQSSINNQPIDNTRGSGALAAYRLYLLWLVENYSNRQTSGASTEVTILDVTNNFDISDLMVTKDLINPQPPFMISVNDTITYRVAYKNLGPTIANSITIEDTYFTNDLQFMDATCDFSLEFLIFTTKLTFNGVNVLPGDLHICDLTFTVLSLPYSDAGQVGNLNTIAIYNDLGFDPDQSQNNDGCLLDSPGMNMPLNQVRCDPKLIWQY